MTLFYSVPGCEAYDLGIERVFNDERLFHSHQLMYIRLINLCRQQPTGIIHKWSARAISRRVDLSPRKTIQNIKYLQEIDYITAEETFNKRGYSTGWIISIPPLPAVEE